MGARLKLGSKGGRKRFCLPTVNLLSPVHIVAEKRDCCNSLTFLRQCRQGFRMDHGEMELKVISMTTNNRRYNIAAETGPRAYFKV